MDCPVCKNTKLLMADRQGIEIDYCPSCRGVWLDRGELDKLIERSAPEISQAPPPQERPAPYQADPYAQQRHGNAPPPYPQSGHPQQGYYKKKRKGFLGELFDFD